MEDVMRTKALTKGLGYVLMVFLAAVVFSGCGDDDSAVTATPAANKAPVANAGPNQSVTNGDVVALDGSGSTDPEGDTLTYSWVMTSSPGGSNAALSSATAVSPSFTADLAGDYVMALIVNDGAADSAPDTVTGTAGPGPNLAPA